MQQSITISQFVDEDFDSVNELLKKTITVNFRNNNITNEIEITEEIDAQIKLVQDYLNKKDSCMVMYSAKLENKLIGIVAYGTQTPKINKYVENEFKNVLEVKNLYILPEHQKMGLGKTLFKAICKDLMQKGHKYFMLYSSFKTGQTYWRKMLGEPYKIVLEKDKERKIWLQQIRKDL